MNTKRREFITLLGGAAAWPLAGRAQTLRHRPLVGSLQVQSLTGSARYASEFLRGMAELGYVEGRNIDFERRYAAGDLRRLPALANELVKLKPDVILTTTSAAALAFTQVTQSIPIVATALDGSLQRLGFYDDARLDDVKHFGQGRGRDFKAAQCILTNELLALQST